MSFIKKLIKVKNELVENEEEFKELTKILGSVAQKATMSFYKDIMRAGLFFEESYTVEEIADGVKETISLFKEEKIVNAVALTILPNYIGAIRQGAERIREWEEGMDEVVEKEMDIGINMSINAITSAQKEPWTFSEREEELF